LKELAERKKASEDAVAAQQLSKE
jgi:hypothetical protein